MPRRKTDEVEEFPGKSQISGLSGIENEKRKDEQIEAARVLYEIMQEEFSKLTMAVQMDVVDAFSSRRAYESLREPIRQLFAVIQHRVSLAGR